MATYNHHWYSTNAGLAYPLDERATARADDDQPVPSDLLVDLQLRWPEALGAYAFLSAVRLSPGLVTLAFQAAADLDATEFQPLATLSLRRADVSAGRLFALTAQADGVGGWAVLGHGCEDEDTLLLLSTARQGLLAPRAARPYRARPVTGLRVRSSATVLTGVVRLQAGAPLEIVGGEREIDGRLRVCAVVQLRRDTESRQAVEDNSEDVLRRFAGPCGGRPESRTCSDPQPIEFINSVAPDCNGVITVQFAGCAEVAAVTDGHGALLDCALGLENACLPGRVPDDDGRLPGEADPIEIVPDSESADSESISAGADEALPFLDCFADMELSATYFHAVLGTWDLVDDADPDAPCAESESISGSAALDWVYEAQSLARRNVLLWRDIDYSTYRRTVSTDVKLLSGATGSGRNGGIVLNYRPHDTVVGQRVYWVVELDHVLQQLAIRRFDGLSFTTLASYTIPGLALNAWYRLDAGVLAGGAGQALLSARVRALDGSGLDVTLGPLAVAGYPPAQGRFGLTANRANARFSFFQVVEDT